MVFGSVVITDLVSMLFYLILIDARIEIEVEGEHITCSETGCGNTINFAVPFIFSLGPITELYLTICGQIQSAYLHVLQIRLSATYKFQTLPMQEIYFSIESLGVDGQDFRDAPERNTVNEKFEELLVGFRFPVGAVSFL